MSDADAIQKLKDGDIDATIVVTGKPAPVLTSLKDTNGLKLLPVPYAKGLEDEYYPATLTHEDYPALIPEGGRVDTDVGLRRAGVVQLAERFGALRQDRQVRRPLLLQFRCVPGGAAPSEMARGEFRGDAGRLEALAAGAAWIDRAKAASSDSASRSHFDAFLAQASGARTTPISDAERADLFRAFLEWNRGAQPELTDVNRRHSLVVVMRRRVSCSVRPTSSSGRPA